MNVHTDRLSVKQMWALYILLTCFLAFLINGYIASSSRAVVSEIELAKALVEGAAWSTYRAALFLTAIILSPLILLAAFRLIPYEDVSRGRSILRFCCGLFFLLIVVALTVYPFDITSDGYFNWRSSFVRFARDNIVSFHFLVFSIAWFLSIVIAVMCRSFIQFFRSR